MKRDISDGWIAGIFVGVILGVLILLGMAFASGSKAADECKAKGGIFVSRSSLCLKPDAVIQ